ncbi:DNA-deoxyinosine glycosylase [Cohnella suwonensis]|uniref:DNA-deoxyinosine glycosylase n=1 Tax=Cohnella suwonensis TaxID=696072 RepID=A0ABW0M454_9BACL
MLVHSFPPLIDSASRLLVLGSMPGAASLRAYEYYGNPRNYMWRILYALYGEGRDVDDVYDDRLRFALGNGIALWDVIASCDRPGSLDSDITRAIPNDVPGLLTEYPGIRAIVCNGTKSYAELTKHFGDDPEIASRRVVRMPSTSPIPTKDYRNLEDRVQAWRAILVL